MATLGLFNLFHPLQQSFKIAIGVDKLCCCFGANAGHTGNIVGGISCERLQLHHLVRRHTKLFHHLSSGEAPRLHRVIHADAIRDQLHQILVRGHDGHLCPHFRRLGGVGGDQVISLIALFFKRDKPKGPRRIADQRKLRHQIFWRGGAIGLVDGIDVIAKARALSIEHNAHVGGHIPIFQGFAHQLIEHVAKAGDRPHRQAIRLAG